MRHLREDCAVYWVCRLSSNHCLGGASRILPVAWGRTTAAARVAKADACEVVEQFNWL